MHLNQESVISICILMEAMLSSNDPDLVFKALERDGLAKIFQMIRLTLSEPA